MHRIFYDIIWILFKFFVDCQIWMFLKKVFYWMFLNVLEVFTVLYSCYFFIYQFLYCKKFNIYAYIYIYIDRY